MQMAIDVAGFSPAEADQLRQAMSSKRSGERMDRLRGPAVRRHGRPAGARWRWPTRSSTALAAFANFGFPESHSVAFAYLVYSSAWCKLHYPAAFTAGLLNAQPMGFWSPQSLVADAKRHGVVVLRPEVNAGRADAALGADRVQRRPPTGPAVRLGLTSVRSIGKETAERIAAGTAVVEHGGPGAPGRCHQGPVGGPRNRRRAR